MRTLLEIRAISFIWSSGKANVFGSVEKVKKPKEKNRKGLAKSKQQNASKRET
jgi:hypothetical protein